MNTLRRLAIEEHGLETIEYALIMGLVSVGSIAVIAAIGTWVSGSFQTVSGQVE